MSNQTRDYGDLRVTMTSDYEWVWDDKRSGASRNVTFYHPKAQGSPRPLGTVCIGEFADINRKRGTLLVGQKPNAAGTPAVASPVRYDFVWNDERSGAAHNGSVWRPVAPSGYVALGDVAAYGWSAPGLDMVWCLRADLVKETSYNEDSIWDDRRSGARRNLSCWGVVPPSIGVTGSENMPIQADCFRGNDQSHTAPPDTRLAHVPVLKVPKDWEDFRAPLPRRRGDTQTLLHGEPGAWFTEGVWTNRTDGEFKRTQRILYGVSTEQRTEMTHSAGVDVSASAGIGFVNFGISLNYQFTSSSSSSFYEYTEKEVTEEIIVPPYHATVMFTKHIWLKATRADGSHVLVQIEVAATDDLHFTGTDLPKKNTAGWR